MFAPAAVRPRSPFARFAARLFSVVTDPPPATPDAAYAHFRDYINCEHPSASAIQTSGGLHVHFHHDDGARELLDFQVHIGVMRSLLASDKGAIFGAVRVSIHGSTTTRLDHACAVACDVFEFARYAEGRLQVWGWAR